MPEQRIFFSWIGKTDLRPLAERLPEDRREEFCRLMEGKLPPLTGTTGPVQTVLAQAGPFKAVHLLSTYPDWLNNEFLRLIATELENCECTVHRVELSSPASYGAVMEAVRGVLGKVEASLAGGRYRLCFHLSSGTPAMAAIWILVGKTQPMPASFYQTHNGRAWEEEIPFDLWWDVVPRLGRSESPDLWSRLLTELREFSESFGEIVGNSVAIRRAKAMAQQAAPSGVPVLLTGETGTGKELFARAIHQASGRKGRFVAVNCGGIPETLLESELFGHKRGAFTGADRDRLGAFREADGGTLFLDEIGECSPSMQVKLLRALQRPPQCVIRPLGSDQEVPVNVRVIAATNRNLIEDVRQSRFREDLYYRLSVVSIRLPPLRERRTDIPAIAKALIDRINEEFQNEVGYRRKRLSPGGLAFLVRQSWPGNVRQLRNMLLRAAVLVPGEELGAAELAPLIDAEPQQEELPLDRPLGNGFSLDALLEEVRRRYIERALREAKGNVAEAARLLGLGSRSALDYHLRKLKLNPQRFQPGD